MSESKNKRLMRKISARTAYAIAAQESMYAVAMLSCPYFRGEGKCSGICYSEPSCITDEPLNGWKSEVLPEHRSLIPDA